TRAVTFQGSCAMPFPARNRLAAIVVGLGVLLVAAFVWKLNGTMTANGSPEPEADEPRVRVQLGEAKRTAAGIQSETCRVRELQSLRVVSGRVTYDESLHVMVRAPVDAVVQEVRVKPGTAVA